MITSTAFAGKHYAVLGLARSGLATVDALLASGARVTAWDDKLFPGEGQDPGRGEEAVPAALDPGLRRGTEIANLNEVDLRQFDSIVVTPGLPLNRHPITQRARDAGVEIIGDIELFARARPELPPHKVVGITGTNGKSTTTALVHHVLQTAGVPSLMGGNIGLPILAQDPLPEGGVYVLELSSYQIDITKTLDCDVAVLLNITPDHLDRYENFDAYAASKMRLFLMQPEDRVGLINEGNVGSDDAHCDLGHDHRRVQGLATFHSADVESLELGHALTGWHNRVNAAAVVAVCRALAVEEEAVRAALRTFPGLPHRMERVREKDGVVFINDSKATNVEAAAPALDAFARVRWIVGGQAKGESLGETARHLDHIVKAYTIGEAGPMFARLLGAAGIAVDQSETLENAVRRAAADSQDGETVLLSPACASFDQFRHFEARGDAFRQLVGAL